MGKTQFTTVTPIPAGVTRETVLATLHDHLAMIDLNPTHEERHRINPPPEATPEEYRMYFLIVRVPSRTLLDIESCFFGMSVA